MEVVGGTWKPAILNISWLTLSGSAS